MFTQIDMKSGKSSERKEPVLEEPHRNMFYNDADALEDAILFPEEFSSEELNPLAIKIVEPIKKWEEEGFSLSRWVEGLDLVDSDDDDKSSYSGGEWVPNDEILEEGAAGSSGSWSDVDEDSDEEIDFTPLMSVDANTRNLFRMVQKNPNSRKPIASDREGMSEEFFTFMDREKARRMTQNHTERLQTNCICSLQTSLASSRSRTSRTSPLRGNARICKRISELHHKRPQFCDSSNCSARCRCHERIRCRRVRHERLTKSPCSHISLLLPALPQNQAGPAIQRLASVQPR